MRRALFRPPAEAHSLILQTDQGCPYNLCTFCGMYKEVPFQQMAMPEVFDLIAVESRHQPSARRIFLADGDVMRRPYAELHAILRTLGECFPKLARVSTYANGSSIAAKTEDQLATLKALRLHTLYMGLESGDEQTLKRCRKGESASTMVDAGQRAESCGIRMSVMVLLGLGSVERSREHAEQTALALTRMQPRLLSALRVIPVPGTELYDELVRGQFTMLTEHQIVEELRALIASLDLKSTVFRANHSSNIVPLEARFPRDKERLLEELDTLLESDSLDRTSPGPMPLSL